MKKVIRLRKPYLLVGGSAFKQLKTIIPHAKLGSVKGTQVTVIKHTVETAKLLRNMGYAAPSPILYDYKWSGHYTPKKHQLVTAAFLTMYMKAFVLNDIGTGKTLSALWAIDYLRKTGALNRVLIVSPLSTLDRVWGDEIFEHFTKEKFAVLYGTRKKRLKLLADKQYNFYIINHDGFHTIVDELADRDDIDLIVVDEFTAYKNSQTDRYKMFYKFIRAHLDKRLWLMSGAPTPNAPTDAWAPVRLVDRGAVPKYYSRFRDMVMRQITTYKWVPRLDSVETLRHIMQPAVRFKRDECLDLPETIYQTRECELTSAQKKAYKDMAEILYAEIATGEVTAANEAVKAMKLIQIACGVVYDDKGNHCHIDAAPRIKLLKELVGEAGQKVIVFVPLTGVLQMLETELSKHWSVAYVDGNVSKPKRDVIFQQFQISPDPHVLIAHPKTMAHGLTLTEASTNIWYAPYPSTEVTLQADGRITRDSQKHVTNIIHIEATKIERAMYATIRRNEKQQGFLLDAIKDMME